MSTYTQIFYHIVFGTKNRQPALTKENRETLYRHVWGLLKNKNCHLYRIGGIEDHMHILTSLHRTVALSSLIKDVKVSSSGLIQREGIFPQFDHWQDGYGAFTHSIADRNRLIEYIKGQEEHHQHVSFVDELKQLLREAGIPFNEKFLE